MEPAIERVSDTVYNAVGFDVANSTFVVGDGGIVVIDAMTGVENLTAALTAFREICDYPVKGVVYSHSHGDHWGGSPALRSFMADGDELPVIAQRRLVAEVGRINGYNQPIMPARSAYQFGAYLPTSAEGVVNVGAGPFLAFGQTAGLVPPNVLPMRLRAELTWYVESTLAVAVTGEVPGTFTPPCAAASSRSRRPTRRTPTAGSPSRTRGRSSTTSSVRGWSRWRAMVGSRSAAHGGSPRASQATSTTPRTQAGSPSRCTAGRNGQAEQSDEGESPWCPGDPETYGFPGGDL